MSVYTPIHAAQLQLFLNRYDLGELIGFNGIENGIENTNYRISTQRGDFILTLFEELGVRQIGDIFALLDHLKQQGISVPHPLSDEHGIRLNRLSGKPAAVLHCLPGYSISEPTTEHCRQIGSHLASLHLHASHSGFQRSNSKNLKGCQSMFDQCKVQLNPHDVELVADELCYQQQFVNTLLPVGVIHADLFRDNVLLTGDKISAILDFYSSCNGEFLFDIAITINDWCRDDNLICAKRTRALLTGYQSIRTLEKSEQQLLPIYLRRAALRFWLSRLNHRLKIKNGDTIQHKDPEEFRRILQLYRDQQPAEVAFVC